ncbi:MAG: tetratricopeptide repeat protein [Gemmataceae bacterium]|nr:tetratricopeptide repeat protein [Gemmataceae bacterium]
MSLVSHLRFGLRLTVLGLILLGTGSLFAQDDKAAQKLLTDAQKAVSEKNFSVAVQRYREFVNQFANHKDAPAARHGLALAILETPDPDYNAVIEQLKMLAGNKEAPEYPSAHFHLGMAHRGLGIRERVKLAQANAQDAPKFQAESQKHIDEAANQFAAAALAYTERAKKAPGAEPKPDQEAAYRARLAQAEMLLQNGKSKEALAVTAALLKDPLLSKGRNQRLALYYDGWARLLNKDFLGAGRALNVIVGFGDAEFGTHARYLLARVHHQEDERAEAISHYEGAIADYEAHKKNAANVLKRPDLLRSNPREKIRLENLVRSPAPEHIARANYQLGVILAEGGRFSDANARFANFIKMSPRSPLVPECMLRQGICLVNLKQWNEAINMLQTLPARQPLLADQALYWLGKAIVGAADPANPQAYQQVMKRGIETLRQAAEKAKEREGDDPDAKARRGAALLELADALQLSGQYKEAAAEYEQLLSSKQLPGREAELLQRAADALGLAGQFAESDKACENFITQYPKSAFLPAIMFRHAENAAFQLKAVEQNPQAPDREKEIARLTAESNKRYESVIKQFPEHEHANLARYGLALALLRKNELEKANAMLATISGTDRTGELALSSYLQADCIIRLAPTKVDDALGAGKLTESMTQAIELLEGFVNNQKGPLTPMALMKIGYCNQRLAALQAQPPEKAKYLTAARVAYKKLYAEHPRDQALPYAVFEEAKCFVNLGAVPRALENLRRFSNDPYKQSPIAPLAFLNLATIFRTQNQAAQGAQVLSQALDQYGDALRKDPTRTAWLPLLQLNLGICLRESGKVPEARGVFEAILKDFPTAPEAADAALRRGQCMKEQAQPAIDKAWQRFSTPNLKPDERTQAAQELTASLKPLAEAAKFLADQAEALKAKQPTSETRARMLYDAAWSERTIGGMESAIARARPDAPKEIPEQPGEKKMRELYQALISGFADLPLSIDARLELGEALADRGDPTTALKLFSEAIDQEPAPEVLDKLRLRMGAAFAAKGDAKTAQAQLEIVAKNPKSPLNSNAKALLKALQDNKPLPPLPLLATARPDRAPLDDATAAVSLAMVTAPVSAQRTKPAPFARMSVPDPYEYRYAIQSPTNATDDVFPMMGTWPPGS